jgi:hypothetical protein
VGARVPTCVWRTSPELLLALEGRFGPPVDAYVNGSQVWLREDGPGGTTIEWRLHPVAGYRRPRGVDTYELFDLVTEALASGSPPPAPLDQLWDGLEAFPAFGDEMEPATLVAACTAALGLPADVAGLADHATVGSEWEQARGGISIVDALLAQLTPGGPMNR